MSELDDKIQRSLREFESAWQEFFKDKPKPKTEEEDMGQQVGFVEWYNNVRKQTDTGKTPAEMEERMIEFGVDEEPPYVPIHLLLRKETAKTKKLKTIFNKEDEYVHLLAPIEEAIIEYYLEHPRTTDKKIMKALKKFIEDPFRDFSRKKNPIEFNIQYAVSVGLQEKPVTLHELKLVAEYILWVIDNRSWMRDKQAYLKWITAFMGYIDKEELDNPIIKTMMDCTEKMMQMDLPAYMEEAEQIRYQEKAVASVKLPRRKPK